MGSTLARTREIAWQSGGTGHYLMASIVPDRGKTTIRLSRSVRRMVVGSGVLASFVAAAVGMATLTVSHRLMHLPGPGWGLRPSHHVINLLSLLCGITAGVLVIPAWRRAVSWVYRAKTAELDSLAARVAGKIRQLIAEERRA